MEGIKNKRIHTVVRPHFSYKLTTLLSNNNMYYSYYIIIIVIYRYDYYYFYYYYIFTLYLRSLRTNGSSCIITIIYCTRYRTRKRCYIELVTLCTAIDDRTKTILFRDSQCAKELSVCNYYPTSVRIFFERILAVRTKTSCL
jgi:hypothetical protein